MKICSGCGGAISGEYISAIGKAWHSVHFVCHYCGGIIDSTYINDNGLPAHKECWVRHNAAVCKQCGQSIIGDYYASMWGELFCHFCQDEGICAYCGGAAVSRDSEGQLACQTCRTIAVLEQEAASRRFDAVSRWAERMGLFDSMPRPPLSLFTRQRMASELGARDCVLGMAQKIYIQQGNRTQVHAKRVVIVRGLPWPIFQMVAAHELGHVWAAQNEIIYIDDAEEEGFCEVVAHLWLEEMGSLGKEGLQRSIETAQDRLYGDGFRKMKDLADRSGLVNLMQLMVARSRIEESRRFPR